MRAAGRGRKESVSLSFSVRHGVRMLLGRAKECARGASSNPDCLSSAAPVLGSWGAVCMREGQLAAAT